MTEQAWALLCIADARMREIEAALEYTTDVEAREVLHCERHSLREDLRIALEGAV